MVWVQVTLREHQLDTHTAFVDAVTAFPEVLEVHHVAGAEDFVLKVVVADIAQYEDWLLHKLTQVPGHRPGPVDVRALDPQGGDRDPRRPGGHHERRTHFRRAVLQLAPHDGQPARGGPDVPRGHARSRRRSAAGARRSARRPWRSACCWLFAIAGTELFKLFGITLPAFRITGGILFFITSLPMLLGRPRRMRRRRRGATPTIVPARGPAHHGARGHQHDHGAHGPGRRTARRSSSCSGPRRSR